MKLLTKISNFQFKDIPDLQGWIGDAKFGLQQISGYFRNNKKYEVLEIGCGIGLLLASLKEKYPIIKVEGIEPYKGGFDRLKQTKNFIPKSLAINHMKFEDFKPKKQYDIIYSINVFEHLLSWKLYLEKTKEWVKPEGINVILCPNYSFPYESHFKVPILLNKNLTYIIFKKKIHRIEKEKKSVGLWKSLNFIKMRNIKSYCLKNDLQFRYCNQIFNDIVNRLDEDKDFKKRQNFVGTFAQKLKKLGILNLFNNNTLYNFHPYMKIEITKMRKNKKY